MSTVAGGASVCVAESNRGVSVAASILLFLGKGGVLGRRESRRHFVVRVVEWTRAPAYF
jgi:hypothetical protein